MPSAAVLFDFWGTLATAPATAAEDALRRALAGSGVDVAHDGFRPAWDAAKAEEASGAAEVDVEDRFRRAFARLGLRPRVVRSAARAAAERYLAEWGASARLFPEAVEALRTLPPEVRVGVVSNFPDAAVFKRTLDRLGLAGRLDAAVCSAEAGRRKPDPAPFRLALERCEADAARSVMVGDGEDDVAGAKAVGLRAIFLARGGRPAPEGADAVATTLAEVPALVAKLVA